MYDIQFHDLVIYTLLIELQNRIILEVEDEIFKNNYYNLLITNHSKS